MSKFYKRKQEEPSTKINCIVSHVHHSTYYICYVSPRHPYIQKVIFCAAAGNCAPLIREMKGS